MHNGQVGGYDAFRRDADMMIPEHLYPHRKGARPTARHCSSWPLPKGWTMIPRGALEQRGGAVHPAGPSEGRGTAPSDDGGPVGRAQRLYAVRYSTDAAAPSLYHRWSESRQRHGRGVRAAGGGREMAGIEVPSATAFCTFDGQTVLLEEFLPCRLAAAA